MDVVIAHLAADTMPFYLNTHPCGLCPCSHPHLAAGLTFGLYLNNVSKVIQVKLT